MQLTRKVLIFRTFSVQKKNDLGVSPLPVIKEAKIFCVKYVLLLYCNSASGLTLAYLLLFQAHGLVMFSQNSFLKW